jgi:hypothetical protein
MGRSSLRTVTLSTRGILFLAKTPSLWEYGVQRYWQGLRAVVPRTRAQPPQGIVMTQTSYH